MNRHLRNAIRGFWSSRGLFIDSTTSLAKVRELIRSLRPMTCGKDLIRLGPEGDGGYLVPDDLAGIKACFSPGTELESGFERDCANLGIPVYLADGSVNGPPDSHELFHFSQKFIGAFSNEEYITLDDWVSHNTPAPASGSEDHLLLQMDIEGAEYEVFLNASEALLQRFRIIVCEFHYLDRLLEKAFYPIAATVFAKLLKTHACVHNHPNNHTGSIRTKDIVLPPCMELTFLRNDRLEDPQPARVFPHPLDVDNSAREPSVPLPPCWYRF